MEFVNPVVIGLALPLTLGAVQVVKDAGMPSRYAAGLAVLLGVVFGVLVQAAFNQTSAANGPLGMAALGGMVAGMSAAGVWSGVKAVRDADR